MLPLLVPCSDRSPAEARAAYDEGQRALREEDHATAIAAFERAADLDPGNTDILLKLGSSVRWAVSSIVSPES